MPCSDMLLKNPALLGNWTLRQSKVGEEIKSDKGCRTLLAHEIRRNGERASTMALTVEQRSMGRQTS